LALLRAEDVFKTQLHKLMAKHQKALRAVARCQADHFVGLPKKQYAPSFTALMPLV